MWLQRQRNATLPLTNSELDHLLVRLSALPLINSAAGSIITIGLWAAILIRHVKIRALGMIQGTRERLGPKIIVQVNNFWSYLDLHWLRVPELFQISKAHPVAAALPAAAGHVSVSQSFLWCALLLLFSRLDKLSSFPSHLSPQPFSLQWSFTSLEFSPFLSRSRSIYDCGSRGRRRSRTFTLFIMERTGLPTATEVRFQLSFSASLFIPFHIITASKVNYPSQSSKRYNS